MIIYTDGAVTSNPGPSGWAYVIVPPNGSIDDIIIAALGEQKSTSNRMEITAIVQALRYAESINYQSSILVYTDSKLICDVVNNNRIDNWIINNFKGIKNQDLWLQLYRYICKFNVNIRWVQSHSGNVYHDLLDKLAKEAKLYQGIPQKINNPVKNFNEKYDELNRISSNN